MFETKEQKIETTGGMEPFGGKLGKYQTIFIQKILIVRKRNTS